MLKPKLCHLFLYSTLKTEGGCVLRRTRIIDVLASDNIGARLTVAGWVRTRRDSKGGFSFIELNDGSCMRGLQVIADGKLPNYGDEILALHTGS